MNEIEKLNERIVQLTELVKSGEETISATKEMLKLAEQERDRLADQWRESEPKFERVYKTLPYWRIAFDNAFGCGVSVLRQVEREWHDFHNMKDFEGNNYFHTEKRAQEVASKINLLLKLERLHDTYCPEYVPDWGNCWLAKYYIHQDKSMGNIWICGAVSTDSDIVQVYFPTEDIAQKVCDILNAEWKEKK